MALMMCGISHETASVDEREKLSLSKNETFDLLSQLYTKREISECIVLSTCNRTELYLVCDDNFTPEALVDFLLTYKNIEEQDLFRLFYHRKSMGVVGHLFSVSSGLKSQVLGENQILRQVKDAYSLAVCAKTGGPFLNKLFHQAFKVGKRARTETSIGVGAVSISSAAVQMVNCVYDTLSNKTALLIGAGETGELAAKLMIERGISSLNIANRTKDNALKMAQNLGANLIEFDKLAAEFLAHDIVICATSSPEYVVTRGMLEPFYKDDQKKTIAVDISVPRNIEPSVADLTNVFLYDMDDLKAVVDKNMEDRRRAASYVEKIIVKSIEEYKTWFNSQRIVPTIKYLQEKFEDIRASEIEKVKHCEGCHKKSELDNVTKRIIKKILRAPITKLMNDTSCSEEELRYLRQMFSGDLDEK